METWLALNPAKALKIDDKTGSLTAGKMADVVLWDRDDIAAELLSGRATASGHEVR